MIDQINELKKAISEKKELIEHYQNGARLKQRDDGESEWRDVTDEKIASLQKDIAAYEMIIAHLS